MQHVLPSRSACIAYHGMSIPLPVHSLYAPHTNSTDCSFDGRKKTTKTDGKDSGVESQITTTTTSSDGATHDDEDSVTSSPSVVGCSTLGGTGENESVVGCCTLGGPGENESGGGCCTLGGPGENGSVGGEANVQQDTCLGEEFPEPLASSDSQSDTKKCPSPSLPPLSMIDVPLPTTAVQWSHVGRGKTLQQVFKTCTSVGRGKTHNTFHRTSTGVGTVCGDTQISINSERICNVAQVEPDHAVNDVKEGDSVACGNICHELLSMRTSGDTSEVCMTCVGSDLRLDSNDQQSNTVDHKNQCHDNIIVDQYHDTANQYHDTVNQHCVTPDQYHDRPDHTVHQQHDVTSTMSLPSLSSLSPQIKKTPKRSKISLAIQFKGVCMLQPVKNNRDSTKLQAALNLSPCEGDITPGKGFTAPPDTTPSLTFTPMIAKEQRVVHQAIESVLPSPSSSPSPLPTTSVESAVYPKEVDCSNKVDDCQQKVMPEEVLDFSKDSVSPEAVLTQVSEFGEDKFIVEDDFIVSLSLSDSDRSEDFKCEALPEDPNATIELACSHSHMQCGMTCVPPVDDVPHVNGEDKDKEKEEGGKGEGGVSEGVRMGRSDAEIENSITLYHRNTHRNRVCISIII